MIVKLLAEHPFEFLSLKGGCSLHMSKCHFVGNYMHWLKCNNKRRIFTAYDDLADLLIQNGAKLNAQMHNGTTALMLACEHVSYFSF